MTLHSNYPLIKDRSIPFSELVLKLDNVINSIKSEYVVFVGHFAALLIVVFFRHTAGKFDQWRHNTNNRAAPQVQPNRWSLLVSVVANPKSIYSFKMFSTITLQYQNDKPGILFIPPCWLLRSSPQVQEHPPPPGPQPSSPRHPWTSSGCSWDRPNQAGWRYQEGTW